MQNPLNSTLATWSRAWSAAACIAVGLCLATGIAGSDIQLARTLQEARGYAWLAAGLAVLAAAGTLLRLHPAGLLAVAITLLLMQFTGIGSIVAVIAFGLASAAVGRRLTRRWGMDDLLVATFFGVFLLTGIVGWLLPFKVHTRLIYTVALAGLLWLERRSVRDILDTIGAGWSEAIAGNRMVASFALIIVAVSLTTAWLPSVMYDDLAYHLMLPVQLLHLGHYRFDVATQVWAVAPWSSDVVHAIADVLAGDDSRGAVNAGWFVLGCCALWRFGSLIGLRNNWKWLAIALYASQPYISGLLGTAQVENELVPLTLVLAGLCVKICRDDDPNAPHAVVILAGLFAALKSSQALVIAPLMLVCAPAFLRAVRNAPARFLAACLLALVLGSASYFYAWRLTGNPLLPLLNELFKSPYFPLHNFHDSRWNQGLNWRTLWDLSFQSGKYQEVYPGAAGFSALALSPFLVAALWWPSLRRTAVWLLLSLIAMFGAIQYLRYIAPLLVVAVPLALFAASRCLAPRIAIASIAALAVLNALMIPASSHVLKNDLLLTQLRGLVKKSKGDPNQRIIERFAFERVAADYLLNDPVKAQSVFLADPERPFTAPFAGRAFASSWYDHVTDTASTAADADPSGAAWRQLLDRNGIRYVLAKTNLPDRPALAMALRDASTAVLKGSEHTLYCLCSQGADKSPADNALYDARDLSARLRHR